MSRSVIIIVSHATEAAGNSLHRAHETLTPWLEHGRVWLGPKPPRLAPPRGRRFTGQALPVAACVV